MAGKRQLAKSLLSCDVPVSKTEFFGLVSLQNKSF